MTNALTCLALLTLLLVVGGEPVWARAPRCTACPRDAHGRIARSSTVRRTFMRETGYPHGRPCYQIDHIIPLTCAGADTVANLQRLSLAEKRAKSDTSSSRASGRPPLP